MSTQTEETLEEITHLEVLVDILADASQKTNEIFQPDGSTVTPAAEVVNLLKNVLHSFSHN